MMIGGCAGSDRPKPAALRPNVALINVRPAWSSNVGVVEFPLEVKVIGDTVFLAGSDGTVAAIDASTGSDRWRLRLATPLAAGVGSDGRYAAVVSKENEVIVIDGGKLSWRQKLGATTLTAPLVAGARVFTLSADRTVSAFDAATGKRLWQQQRTGDALVLGEAGLLTAINDTLVAGLSGRVVGMNPANGNSRWEVIIANSRGTNEVERLVDVVAGFSRDGDQLCARAFQYVVGCIDATAGKVQWNKPAVGAKGVGGDSQRIYSPESDGTLIAWSRKDGERAWVSERLRFRNLTAPLVLSRAMVIGDDDGNVHFLSKADASPLNRISTDGSGIATMPVLVGDTVVVVTRKGSVRGLRVD
jgi:outer membrane assembly lipoprotein YfgL